jgi:hypothetical protein
MKGTIHNSDDALPIEPCTENQTGLQPSEWRRERGGKKPKALEIQGDEQERQCAEEQP